MVFKEYLFCKLEFLYLNSFFVTYFVQWIIFNVHISDLTCWIFSRIHEIINLKLIVIINIIVTIFRLKCSIKIESSKGKIGQTTGSSWPLSENVCQKYI